MEWPICEVDECERPVQVRKRGLCQKHYSRWWKTGDPTQAAYDRNDDPDRWQTMWEVAENGCWLWTGRTDGQGYGVWSSTTDGVRTTTGAHRHVYQMLRCLLERHEHLDHRCHSDDQSCPGGPGDPHRRCVNPDHMEVVSHKVNAGRAHSANARKTHCPAGHPYDEANTLVTDRGHRECRTCRREGARVRVRRHRAGESRTTPVTHCKRGHEFTPENTYITSIGGRQCKECVKAANREKKARQRARARGEDSVAAPNGAKTHCKHGHEFTPENTRITPHGARVCRACDREAARRQRA